MIVCLHSTWYKGLRLEMPDLYERVYAINIASYWSGNETIRLHVWQPDISHSVWRCSLSMALVGGGNPFK